MVIAMHSNFPLEIYARASLGHRSAEGRSSSNSHVTVSDQFFSCDQSLMLSVPSRGVCHARWGSEAPRKHLQQEEAGWPERKLVSQSML